MREIKFRGKRTDNGEWISGSFIDWGNGVQVFIMPIIDIASSLSFSEYVGIKARAVNYKTIGQFTGLYDKNGKEIYEGDIVSLNKDLLGCYVVKYDENRARFSMYINGYEQAGFNNETMKAHKVIGNIYDNPELIRE